MTKNQTMTATPEISRLNGAKPRGPRSARGKAIAAKNASKHGLLAKQPPLLVTEDLSSFQGLLQGLIDHYQPEGPVEQFLVQQLAVGMLKQYRLWTVEAASANVEILKAQQSAKFPDIVGPPTLEFHNPNFDEKCIALQQALKDECQILERLIDLFDEDLKLLDTTANLQEWLDGVRESSSSAYYHRERSAAVYKAQDEFDQWLEPWTYERDEQELSEPMPSAKEVVTRFKKIQKLARERIQKINQTLAEIGATEGAIAQARIVSQGMQQQELFNRYQRNINRELYKALNQLEAALKQRHYESSIGSFSQTIAEQEMRTSLAGIVAP